MPRFRTPVPAKGFAGPDTPAVARLWNHWLGGVDNYAADRELAAGLEAVTPGLARIPAASRRLREERITGHVIDVWTDGRRKQAGFSLLKSAMQSGTLVLPRDPDLMRELSHLDYERTPAGSLRIAARQGAHDDRAMSLLQAVSCIRQQARPDGASWPPMFDHVVTGRGTFMPVKPRPVEHSTSFFRTPGRPRARHRGGVVTGRA